RDWGRELWTYRSFAPNASNAVNALSVRYSCSASAAAAARMASRSSGGNRRSSAAVQIRAGTFGSMVGIIRSSEIEDHLSETITHLCAGCQSTESLPELPPPLPRLRRVQEHRHDFRLRLDALERAGRQAHSQRAAVVRTVRDADLVVVKNAVSVGLVARRHAQLKLSPAIRTPNRRREVQHDVTSRSPAPPPSRRA